MHICEYSRSFDTIEGAKAYLSCRRPYVSVLEGFRHI